MSGAADTGTADALLSSMLHPRASTLRAVDAARSRLFDVRYGVDTHERADPVAFGAVSDNLAHGVAYQPTRVRDFRQIMRRIPVHRSDVFVDLGCGKGRVLLLAAGFPLARVIGVEYAPGLCAIARENVINYRRHVAWRPLAPIEVVHADAAAYEFPDDATIVFLFNPFDDTVMRGVLANLEASHARRPRAIRLVYYHPPRHAAAVIRESRLMNDEVAFKVNGRGVLVWQLTAV